MKVFVTGGAGFIGSALSYSLLKNGHQVTIFDNLSNSSKEATSELIENGAKFVKGDVTDYNSLAKALSDFDVAAHLAAKINVQESIKNPDNTRKININGTINLLRACVENKTKNVIIASTAAVYGTPKKLPLLENSPTSPISPYSESKLAMEQHIREFSTKYGVNCITLRFFNVYGKSQSDAYAGVITKFLKNISENKPLLIFGDGSYTRDFIHIDDAVDAINNAIEKIEEKRGDCYNIATGRAVSIKELAELMLSISGKKLEIKFEPPKKGDIPHSQANIDLAKKELGFFPKISLKEGLEKLLLSSN